MTTTHQITAPSAFPLVGDGLDISRSLLRSGDYEECIIEARAVRSTAHGPVKQMASYLIEATARFYQTRYGESLKVLEAAASLYESVAPLQKAKYFAQRAAALRKRNDVRRGDHDAALIDYEAARYWAEESNDELTLSSIRNNLAKIYSEARRFDEAIAESDLAIKTAQKLNDDVYLGLFHDQRAQILIDKKDYQGAAVFSREAMRLLEGHPSQVEARETHGMALIGLGDTYLESSDPLESLRARRAAVKLIDSSPNEDVISLALERAGGKVAKAASLLGMQHSAVIKLVRQKGLTRSPQRHRGKSVSKK